MKKKIVIGFILLAVGFAVYSQRNSMYGALSEVLFFVVFACILWYSLKQRYKKEDAESQGFPQHGAKGPRKDVPRSDERRTDHREAFVSPANAAIAAK